MLSQDDFRSLLSSGGGGGGDDKARFDLKQISKWDRENKQAEKFAKKPKKSGPPGLVSRDDDNSSESQVKYRDRALERRLDDNPDYDKEREEIAMQLDAEKTKFLGGDESSTHFVRGLDYMLLQKQKQSAPSSEHILPPERGPRKLIKDVKPTSLFGKKMHGYFMLHPPRSAGPVACGKSAAGSLLARTVYEFSLTGDKELPASVSQSKQDDVHDGETAIHYILPERLLIKLTKTLTEFRLNGRGKRKRTEVQPEKPVALAPALVVDTIGDIFEDVGVYNPDDALRSTGNVSGVIGSIFEGLRAKTKQELEAERAAAVQTTMSGSQLVAKVINDNTTGDCGDRNNIAPEKRVSTIAAVEVTDESDKIHRDIFGMREDKPIDTKKKQVAGISFVGTSYEGGSLLNFGEVDSDDDDRYVGGDGSDDDDKAGRTAGSKLPAGGGTGNKKKEKKQKG